ncbi:TIM barrel protein [Rubellimicrobium sp. CFH 75288]|uniref:TIM barrel protein n=1 Tax=Rubellimicrobium sp. CFH 75288 TaxID=2697034 RepID=UPI001411D08C|nr:TIM barrel protein [Rubellimicrobium sp. CFH 75288]NAZ36128.1 TIM barrel protein [Rubellimicrobium sp. CFH 75288]
MPAFAINHMTAPALSFARLADLAATLGCAGVEARTDLGRPPFDGAEPAAAGAALRARGLRLLALAELARFNDWTGDRESEALSLIRAAAAAGAEGVALIPRNDGAGLNNGERQANLRVALRALGPILEDHGLIGLIEPLGFETSSLRLKEEAAEAVEALGLRGRFRLVHDTFHHHLAGEAALFPDLTGLVHVSGVEDPAPSASEMRDGHRVLPGPGDRLGSVAQIRALEAAGWRGVASVECFAASVHALPDPEGALRRSMEFLRDGVAREAA